LVPTSAASHIDRAAEIQVQQKVNKRGATRFTNRNTMAASAENLRDLHALHHRAKAMRDLLVSGPKTLAARQQVLAGRHAALEHAKKALQDERVGVKKHEHSLQGHQTKIDDLKVKLNQVRKNEEYKALQNQIAHDQKHQEKLELEILEGMMKVDEKAAECAALEGEIKKTAGEVEELKGRVESQAASLQTQLAELEQAIAQAESIIPADQRDQYRRTLKQHGPEAFASVSIEDKACSGCFVSVTPQMINELINCVSLNFCKTCGRILYLAEEDRLATARKVP
jgi:predicted  nucleic acid-binding Zn-ribbon protein